MRLPSRNVVMPTILTGTNVLNLKQKEKKKCEAECLEFSLRTAVIFGGGTGL